jgi:hypothetical protein
MPLPRAPTDDEKIEEVYIDESSQTGHRLMVIGSISLPHRFSDQFAQDILDARRPRLAAERPDKSELREMKWKDINKGEFEAYRRVVDAYFDFAHKHIKDGQGAVEFHCTTILTQVRGRVFSGARGMKALNNEFFQHCLRIAVYHKSNFFHFYLDRLYLDRRHTDERAVADHDAKLRNKLCSLLKHNGDPRNYVARKVKSRHSHEVQALQVVDLLIGAVAFRLNRHYEAADANPDKKLLCEYILRRGGIWDLIDSERHQFKEKKSGRFQLRHQRVAEAKRNPPRRSPHSPTSATTPHRPHKPSPSPPAISAPKPIPRSSYGAG